MHIGHAHHQTTSLASKTGPSTQQRLRPPVGLDNATQACANAAGHESLHRDLAGHTVLDGGKRHGALHERRSAHGDVIVVIRGEELVGDGVHEALDAHRPIIGCDIESALRAAHAVLELLRAGDTIGRRGSDDDIDARTLRGELICKKLESRSAHTTASK